jgi:hypothetical protein
MLILGNGHARFARVKSCPHAGQHWRLEGEDLSARLVRGKAPGLRRLPGGRLQADRNDRIVFAIDVDGIYRPPSFRVDDICIQPWPSPSKEEWH